jgi:hypothetical protein
VAAKFINGGNVYGGPNDSASGASPAGFPPIPEPSSAALLIAGLGGLLAAGRWH